MKVTNVPFEIIMSCMHQEGFDIVNKSQIQCPILIVNQCDKNEIITANDRQNCRMICTTERGLSRSRNMAMKNAEGEIVLLADDDEIFVPNVQNLILNAFEMTGADIIAFDLGNYEKNIKKRIHRLNRFQTLRISSCQVAMRIDSIRKADLDFDINLGAGTPNGGGEESKFLWDAHKKGLIICYVPICIARLTENESTWFSGFNEEFFYKRGKATSYFMGKGWAFIYALYFVLAKYSRYRKDCSFIKASAAIMKGINCEKNFGNS